MIIYLFFEILSGTVPIISLNLMTSKCKLQLIAFIRIIFKGNVINAAFEMQKIGRTDFLDINYFFAQNVVSESVCRSLTGF